MSRTLLLVALVGVVGCTRPGRQPLTDDTAAFDTEVRDSARETGLWPDDSDPWPDSDTDADTDTALPDTDLGCTKPGWTIDCSGLCSSTTLVGDGFCDDGPGTKPDFFCSDFEFDGGDCVVDTAPDTDLCPFPGEIPDCNGNCFASFLVGDGECHDAPAPGVDFACEQFDDDGGDCVVDSDTQIVDTDTAVDPDEIAVPCPDPLDVRDCTATCWPEAWLGDDRSDDGTERVWGDPDFDCPYYEHDRGDCPDTDPPVETAVPVDSDTDVPVDSDTDVPVDSDTDVTTDTDVPVDSDTDVTTDTDVPVDSDTDSPVDTVVVDTLVPIDTLIPDTLVP